MSNNQDEYVSLFEYLGKRAGEDAKKVYEAAKANKEVVKNREVKTDRFEGKVLTYRRGFLDIYFQSR